MTINGSRLHGALGAVLPSDASGDTDLIKAYVTRRTILWEGNDNATAATNVAESVAYQNKTGASVKVVSVNIAAPKDITASASNYASAVVKAYYANGTAVGNVAVISTSPTANSGTGDLTAHTLATSNAALSNFTLSNGQFLTAQWLKEGNGVALCSAATPQSAPAKIEIVIEPA